MREGQIERALDSVAKAFVPTHYYRFWDSVIPLCPACVAQFEAHGISCDCWEPIEHDEAHCSHPDRDDYRQLLAYEQEHYSHI